MSIGQTVNTDTNLNQFVDLQDGSGNPLSSAGGSLNVQVTNAAAIAVSQSGNWSVRVEDGSGNSIGSTSGALNVEIANATAISVAQSGVWTVQPGNTQNTTPWLVQDSADGPVTAGTVASKSMLTGVQFNTTLPTLTTGQQSAIQADSSGRLLIGSIASALPAGTNTIGKVELLDGSGNSIGSTSGGLNVEITNSTAISVAQSGVWSVRTQDGSGNNLTSTSGSLNANVTGTVNNSDVSGTGTIAALNGTVVATTNGCSTITFDVTGTWVATIEFQGTADGTNWVTLQFYIPSSLTITNSITGNVTVLLNCGGYKQIRGIAAAYTSGTATLAYNAGAGINIPLQSTTAMAESAVQSYSATSVNPLLADLRGALLTTMLDGSRQTYSATSAIGFASATAATDIFTITGSATKTVRVLKIAFSAQETTAGVANVLVVKRSTANTGGTSAAATAVPHDSTNAAATATVLNYTANPTLGTAVGTVKAARIFIPTAGTDTADFVNEFAFDDGIAQAIVLRGTSQVLSINLNGTTVTGGTWTCYVVWSEE